MPRLALSPVPAERAEADLLVLPVAAGEAGLATRPADGEALESGRLKARLGEMLLERELLEAKIAALEARGTGPLARRRPTP